MHIIKKFNSLTSWKKFCILFWGLFIICLPAIPFAINSDRRIFLNEMTDLHFTIFAIICCAAYAFLLAGAGVVAEKIIKKLKGN